MKIHIAVKRSLWAQLVDLLHLRRPRRVKMVVVGLMRFDAEQGKWVDVDDDEG